MSKKKKPAPISMSLAGGRKSPEKPVMSPADPAKLGGINKLSPLVEKQLARQQRSVENLFEQVKDMRAQLDQPAEPVVPVVNIAPRPRITKVQIKYDQMGYPKELIPQYEG